MMSKAIIVGIMMVVGSAMALALLWESVVVKKTREKIGLFITAVLFLLMVGIVYTKAVNMHIIKEFF